MQPAEPGPPAVPQPAVKQQWPRLGRPSAKRVGVHCGSSSKGKGNSREEYWNGVYLVYGVYEVYGFSWDFVYGIILVEKRLLALYRWTSNEKNSCF